MHFASRRKIINHHVAGVTRESHPRVQDLQHPRLGKPRRGLQILDTRMGFPRPSRNVVIDSIILNPQLSPVVPLRLHGEARMELWVENDEGHGPKRMEEIKE